MSAVTLGKENLATDFLERGGDDGLRSVRPRRARPVVGENVSCDSDGAA